MKKPIALILCTAILSTGLFTACSKEDSKDDNTSESKVESSQEDADETLPEANTPGTKIYAQFYQNVKDEKDVVKLAESLASEKITGYDCGVMEVEPGYLNGFTDTVDGFSEGSMFSPYIGSVPFVGYVFKSDDPAALKDKLLSLADPRWNICTEADETVCEVNGDYVFFVMCPNE
ncbi:MAG: hypothetical protein MJ108_09485 [Saccharofermentans sp.]|nr:hypothetical protein [Saccharofermentans sp.]